MPEILSLSNLFQGGAVEQFDHELQKVLANIQDPNTDPKAVRKIGLELTIKPDQDRTIAGTTVKITSKLAAFKPTEGRIFIGEDQGRMVATESNPNQATFELSDMENDPNVIEFKYREGDSNR